MGGMDDLIEIGNQHQAAIDEVARLRTQVRLLADEVERLRLTDAERKAIEYGIAECEATAALCSERPNIDAACTALAALRGLLERTK
jgi:hypothetical protein